MRCFPRHRLMPTRLRAIRGCIFHCARIRATCPWRSAAATARAAVARSRSIAGGTDGALFQVRLRIGEEAREHRGIGAVGRSDQVEQAARVLEVRTPHQLAGAARGPHQMRERLDDEAHEIGIGAREAAAAKLAHQVELRAAAQRTQLRRDVLARACRRSSGRGTSRRAPPHAAARRRSRWSRRARRGYAPYALP